MSRTYHGITYTNGRCPPSILAPLDGQAGAELREDAADAWNRARAHAHADAGILLSVVGWNRTLAEQVNIFTSRYTPRQAGSGPYGDVRWYNGVRYVRMRGAAAAIPGTSNHGWALAVDVANFGAVGQWNHPRRAATIDILRHHGWTDDEGRDVGEPWHLVYQPARDQGEGDDMFTEADRKMLAKADDASWVKQRIGGSVHGETLEAKVKRTDVNVRQLEAKVNRILELLEAREVSADTES